VQDLSLIHVDRGFPAVLGDRVTVGHRCVVHGCRVEDDATIGMGAVLLSGSVVGRGAVVAAGAVVREGQIIAPEVIVAGVPARERGRVTDSLRRRLESGVRSYVDAARRYASGELGTGPYSGRGSVE
jgi:carbonic anhydrase/acetyltransferase-like protein (isoleucine patch superfamily)